MLPHCTTLTRYDLSITTRNYDIYSPFYGQPEWYFVHPPTLVPRSLFTAAGYSGSTAFARRPEVGLAYL